MPAESGTDVPLETAYVLFMDVVGYSKRLVNEQRELQQQLTDIVRGTEQFRAAEATGKLIRIPAGDGMALVFFNRLEAPVQCAVEISKAVKNHPHIQLRMEINMAQRIMDCADAGHILLSQRVAEDLAQSRLWRPHLHDLGECAVKHGIGVFVVNLFTGEVGNPHLPEKLKKAQEEQAAAAAASRPPPTVRRKNVLIAAATLG